MKKNSMCSLWFLLITMFLYSFNCSVGQTTKNIEPETAILSVSEQQEENFNKFVQFLDNQESLKLVGENLKSVYEKVFVAMKQNDYKEYIINKEILDKEFANLNENQRNTILEFFHTLTPIELNEKEIPANSCKVSCLFGSCEITCPDGSKPKCRCEWYGAPDCGCEPFSLNK